MTIAAPRHGARSGYSRKGRFLAIAEDRDADEHDSEQGEELH